MAIIGKVVGSLGLGLVALVGYGIYLEWEVKRWDQKIDALCAANGGRDVAVRVYETVMAPDTKEYFAETKPVRSFYVPTREAGQSLGPKFPYVLETEKLAVLNDKDPHVYKYVSRVVRAADNKVLGEQIKYMRGGGGIPFPDPSTPHFCSQDPRIPGLTVRVFLNHPFQSVGVSK